MRSSEASLLSVFSLAAPSADSWEPRACSVSLCAGAGAAGGGCAVDSLGAATGGGAAAGGEGGACWRPQLASARQKRAIRADRRFIGDSATDSAHALHVGGHVADLLRSHPLGEGEHHHAVRGRLLRVLARVARAARIVVQLLHHIN